jgi:hypothetical protein
MARLDRSLEYINTAREIGGFGQNFVAGISGLVLAAFTMITGIGEAIAALFVGLTDATRLSAVALVYAIFRAPARFLQDSWNTAAIQLGLSPWNTLGPFVVVIAGGTVIATVGLFSWYLDRRDSDFLGTGLDVPWVGNDADDNEEE